MTSEQRFEVLAVDDDVSLVALIRTVLSDDFDVTTTTSPREALRLIDTHDFHVVCADYRMPGISGLEVLQRAASRPVFTSGLLITGAEEYFHTEEKGAHYVLLKPFEPERLLALVQQLAHVAQMKRAVSTR
jgi:DNA-binding NtrC family response regulator